MLLGDHEAAETEGETAHDPADCADAERSRERKRAEGGHSDVEDPQQQESFDRRKQPSREKRRRVERADLALREEREAAEDVRRPQWQLSGPERSVEQRKHRIEVRERVGLSVDANTDQHRPEDGHNRAEQRRGRHHFAREDQSKAMRECAPEVAPGQDEGSGRQLQAGDDSEAFALSFSARHAFRYPASAVRTRQSRPAARTSRRWMAPLGEPELPPILGSRESNAIGLGPQLQRRHLDAAGRRPRAPRRRSRPAMSAVARR